MGTLFSTTEKYDLLMWAHYANKHSGLSVRLGMKRSERSFRGSNLASIMLMAIDRSTLPCAVAF